MTEAKKRYKDYNPKTIEYMAILWESIVKEYGKLDDAYLLSFDMIADNYDILIQARDDIRAHGLRQVDSKSRESKNDSIQIFNTAQSNISKLINQFGKTIMAKSKIKQSASEEESPIDKFLSVTA